MGTFVPELTLNLRNMVVLDQGGQAWNAFADKYGVTGDGDTDDWAGLQQWINDGITSGKKLIMPPPPVTCLFSKPLLFNMANTYNESLGVSPAPLYLECQPGYNATGGGYALTYTGPSYQSALQFLGIQNGVIKGLTINIGGADPTVTNVVALDFICTNSLPNMGNLHLEDINVLFQGSGGNHVAYRFGQSGRTVYDGVAVASSYDFSSATAIFTSADVGSALIAIGIPSGTTISAVTDPSHVVLNNAATASGTSLMTTIGGGSASNISGTHMVNCTATGGGAQYGSIGCQIGGGEVVPFYAANCKMSELGCAWLAGGVQSLTTTTLTPVDTTLPLQSALLFPTPCPGGTGMVIVAGTAVTYAGKDVTSRFTSDGVVNGTTTLTSATLDFDPVYDLGATIYAVYTVDGSVNLAVPIGTTIQAVNGSSPPYTSVTMSNNALISETGVKVTIYRNILKGCVGVPTIGYTGATVQSVVPGQGLYDGGGDTTWVGCSGGGNHWDFYFGNGDITLACKILTYSCWQHTGLMGAGNNS